MSGTKIGFWLIVAVALAVLGFVVIPRVLESNVASSNAATLVHEGNRTLLELNEGGNKRARDLYSKAATRGEEALRLDPANTAARLLLGKAYSGLKDNNKAIEHLDLYLQSDPENPEALLEAGLAYAARWDLSQKSDDRIEAVKHLEHALAIRGDDPAALFRLGEIAERDRDNDRRDEFWRRLIQASPNSPQAALALQKNPALAR